MINAVFVRVPERRYMEMLEILPPAHWTGKGFLVGEPTTHRKCTVTNVMRPAYSAFITFRDMYYEGPDMTRPEFDAYDVANLPTSASEELLV